MIQSTRPLPFETWARDLRQLAGGVPGITSTVAMVARQLAGARESTRAVAPTLPDHEPREVDVALGSHVRLEQSDIVIVGFKPILAGAAAAEKARRQPTVATSFGAAGQGRDGRRARAP